VAAGVPSAPVRDGSVADTEPSADFDHIGVAVGRARVGWSAVFELALAVAHTAKLAGNLALTWVFLE